jgi:uncharacterized membrane protein
MTSGEGIEMDKNEAHSENESRLLRLEQEVADLRERLAHLEVPSESEAASEPSTEPVVQHVPQSIDRVAITEESPPTIAPLTPQPPDEPVVSAPPPEVAPPVSPPPAPRKTVPSGPSPIHKILGAMHLMPPAEGSGEVQLGAWWTTRIGALLAVIGRKRMRR